MLASIPTIETDRLILRAPRPADLPAFTAFFQTSRSHFVGGPRDAIDCFTRLGARIGHWAMLGYGLWHITLKDGDDFIGWSGVINPPGWDEPELGWALLSDAEGNGIAFEATTAARRYCAEQLGLDGLISYIDPANTRSLSLATRLGAQFERASVLLGTPCHIYRHPTAKGAA